jgi:hypothetical protein
VLVRRRIENDNTKSATLGGEFSDVAAARCRFRAGGPGGRERPAAQRIHLSTAKGAVTAPYDPATYPYTLAPTTAAFTDRPPLSAR